MFQEFNLLPGLTALENVRLPLRYAGGNGDGRQRARRLLSEVGLAERERHRPGELSGGTFVVVTHDADLAAHADRLIRLQVGRVASERRPS